MIKVLKLIRYNTGTDKKLFTEFASNFDAVVMNATIAAYSGSAMADLVSIYKDKYIIDPQTHILQQHFDTLATTTKKGYVIKSSVAKYLEKLPDVLLSTLNSKKKIEFDLIQSNIIELVKKVGEFQLKHINSFMTDKEYNKYIDFIEEDEGVGSILDPKPQLLIAPYFMLKAQYTPEEMSEWLALNRQAIQLFVKEFSECQFPKAAQLVLEKDVLESILHDETNMLKAIVDTYNDLDFEYIFVWIDEFSPISSDDKYTRAFAELLKALNRIGKYPIMAYGGYDSILLCHNDSPTKMYGVVQSVGYGEQRQITPVGGGLPTNKYYFPPTHQRLKLEDMIRILSARGYFDNNKPVSVRGKEFFDEICGCPQCRDIIQNDINNFSYYNESTPFVMKKSGIHRNRATQYAIEIAARHYLHQKAIEWGSLDDQQFIALLDVYKSNVMKYGKYYDNGLHLKVLAWIEYYGK